MIFNKIPIFARCLEDGGVAQVYVRHVPGLRIPASVVPPAVLEYGWSMPISIPDHKWDNKGISATLSFDQSPFHTFVPWDAIVAIGPKGQGVIVSWDFYVPAVVQEEVNPQPAAPDSTKRTLPTLFIVRGNP